MVDQNARYLFRMKLCSRGFSGSLIMNLNTRFRISIDGSNMADRNAKSYLFWMKLDTRGSLRSLITIRRTLNLEPMIVYFLNAK